MLAEVGHFSLIIAFVLALLLAVVPLWGAWRNQTSVMLLAPSLAVGGLCFSLGCLWPVSGLVPAGRFFAQGRSLKLQQFAAHYL